MIMLATHNLPFSHVVFEVVSAVRTVGLSRRDHRTTCTRSARVLIVLMFIGRVGPHRRWRWPSGRRRPGG